MASIADQIMTNHLITAMGSVVGEGRGKQDYRNNPDSFTQQIVRKMVRIPEMSHGSERTHYDLWARVGILFQ